MEGVCGGYVGVVAEVGWLDFNDWTDVAGPSEDVKYNKYNK